MTTENQPRVDIQILSAISGSSNRSGLSRVVLPPFVPPESSCPLANVEWLPDDYLGSHPILPTWNVAEEYFEYADVGVGFGKRQLGALIPFGTWNEGFRPAEFIIIAETESKMEISLDFLDSSGDDISGEFLSQFAYDYSGETAIAGPFNPSSFDSDIEALAVNIAAPNTSEVNPNNVRAVKKICFDPVWVDVTDPTYWTPTSGVWNAVEEAWEINPASGPSTLLLVMTPENPMYGKNPRALKMVVSESYFNQMMAFDTDGEEIGATYYVGTRYNPEAGREAMYLPMMGENAFPVLRVYASRQFGYESSIENAYVYGIYFYE